MWKVVLNRYLPLLAVTVAEAQPTEEKTKLRRKNKTKCNKQTSSISRQLLLLEMCIRGHATPSKFQTGGDSPALLLIFIL